jgi:hypothetical protein
MENVRTTYGGRIAALNALAGSEAAAQLRVSDD